MNYRRLQGSLFACLCRALFDIQFERIVFVVAGKAIDSLVSDGTTIALNKTTGCVCQARACLFKCVICSLLANLVIYSLNFDVAGETLSRI